MEADSPLMQFLGHAGDGGRRARWGRAHRPADARQRRRASQSRRLVWFPRSEMHQVGGGEPAGGAASLPGRSGRQSGAARVSGGVIDSEVPRRGKRETE
jgi:hypothetical protein